MRFHCAGDYFTNIFFFPPELLPAAPCSARYRRYASLKSAGVRGPLCFAIDFAMNAYVSQRYVSSYLLRREDGDDAGAARRSGLHTLFDDFTDEDFGESTHDGENGRRD